MKNKKRILTNSRLGCLARGFRDKEIEWKRKKAVEETKCLEEYTEARALQGVSLLLSTGGAAAFHLVVYTSVFISFFSDVPVLNSPRLESSAQVRAAARGLGLNNGLGAFALHFVLRPKAEAPAAFLFARSCAAGHGRPEETAYVHSLGPCRLLSP